MTAAQREQQRLDFAAGVSGVTAPPPLSEGVEARKLFNFLARKMLDRCVEDRYPHGTVLLRMLVQAGYDAGMISPPLHATLPDFFAALLECFAMERKLGEKMAQVGGVFANGVITRDDIMGMVKTGNALDPPPKEGSGRSGGGGGAGTSSPTKQGGGGRNARRGAQLQSRAPVIPPKPPARERKSDGGKAEKAATSEEEGEVKETGKCPHCPNRHSGTQCVYDPKHPDFTTVYIKDPTPAQWDEIHRLKRKRRQDRKGREGGEDRANSEGEAHSDSSCERLWVEPTDCLFACEECKFDSCRIHNRVPVFLSVSDQDSAEAAVMVEEVTPSGKDTRATRKARSGSTALERSKKRKTLDPPVEVTARLDTGSSLRNFIRKDLADVLVSRGSEIVAVKGGIRGRFSNEPGRVYNKAVIFNYGFWNQILRSTKQIVMKAVVMEELDVPLIIGVHSIGEHGLLCLQKPELCHPMCGHSREYSVTIPSLTRTLAQSTGVPTVSDTPPRRVGTVKQAAARVMGLALQMRRAAPQGDLGNAAPAFQSAAGKTSATVRSEWGTSVETDTGEVGHCKSTEPLPGLISRPRGVGRLTPEGGTSSREVCELCQVRSSSGDLFGSGVDSVRVTRKSRLSTSRNCCPA